MTGLSGLFFLSQSIKKKHSNKQEMGTYLRFIVSRMKERVSVCLAPCTVALAVGTMETFAYIFGYGLVWFPRQGLYM